RRRPSCHYSCCDGLSGLACGAPADAEPCEEACPARSSRSVVPEHGLEQQLALAAGEQRVREKWIERELANGVAAQLERLDHGARFRQCREPSLAAFEGEPGAPLASNQAGHGPEPSRPLVRGLVEPGDEEHERVRLEP